ncbi:MAG: ATP-dependent sacrificial sulfur transferase LarE [Termitinemataceae bacterium]|nr:MAG: ATP-dependent sacrificial sulfur transferase LarE [Termitinemataceae bacterium]
MEVDFKKLTEKYLNLVEIIKKEGCVAVAFSGGVDSSFLCYAAFDALNEKAIAITIVSPMMPQNEIADAKKISSLIGIKHIMLEEAEIDDAVAANPKDRCYHCKKIEFGSIIAEAKKRGVNTVLDGSNTDDTKDYRPGLKALSELSVLSPLRLADLSKQDIRDLSKKFNIPTWNKPAAACLASRIPYGETISKEKLRRIEDAENILRECGFNQFRVRSHGDIARIEVAPNERQLFFNSETLNHVSKQIKNAGFLFVAMELEGYDMGSLNRVHQK